jgi:hypothetical protein
MTNLPPSSFPKNKIKFTVTGIVPVSHGDTILGPVVQRWVSANPGLKFNLLLYSSLCISARLFISKLERRKL